LGRKIEVGHDLPMKYELESEAVNVDQEVKEEIAGPPPKRFEAEIPLGAAVVSLSGVIGNKRLLSLMAYYS